jgi:hypothetical protein
VAVSRAAWKAACQDVLDCYVENDCGPDSCTGVNDACGQNEIDQGTAPYEFANPVYECLCD